MIGSIRPTQTTDLPAILAIYPSAFPDEDLTRVVKDLHGRNDVVAFVAIVSNKIIGHIVFTDCRVRDDDRVIALLGPLAVHPDYARQGVGSALVRMGIDAQRGRDVVGVLVLGDPAYYGRFGFETERDIGAPYPLPDDWAEAWRSLWLADRPSLAAQALIVPAPWREPAYWS